MGAVRRIYQHLALPFVSEGFTVVTSKPLPVVVRTTFRAPLPFVLRWCTDYSPEDSGLEGDAFRRQILERTSRRVVYEDLDTSVGGWLWSRWVVTIQPPDRWHGESVGNYRKWDVDYRLTPLADGRTQLTLRGQRTPFALGRKSPSKTAIEKNLAKSWERFARALESDYRKQLRSRRPRRGG